MDEIENDEEQALQTNESKNISSHLHIDLSLFYRKENSIAGVISSVKELLKVTPEKVRLGHERL